MRSPENRRYAISEVSELTAVSPHVLRQWEERYPQLKPKRDRANRRTYNTHDIEIVQRIQQLTHEEGMTTAGAKQRLAEELAGGSRPKTNRDVVELIDNIQSEARAIMEILDRKETK